MNTKPEALEEEDGPKHKFASDAQRRAFFGTLKNGQTPNSLKDYMHVAELDRRMVGVAEECIDITAMEYGHGDNIIRTRGTRSVDIVNRYLNDLGLVENFA